jgi:hypothetical protein
MTTMEIEALSKDDLIKTYVELNREKDTIELQQDLIKKSLKNKLETENLKNFSNSFGEVSIMNQKRNNFQQQVAKKFLTDEQLAECYKEIEVSFVKIVSVESKANMRF